MDLSFKALQKHWDLFASRDALWAILTHPDRKDKGWDVGEFFETGVWEVERSLERVARARPELSKRRALDFGCGVGRLTQALALHFEQVHGVDISGAMIEKAREYNRHGERCQYVVNQKLDLQIFPDRHFDFIYSHITLQHMPPRYSRRYIAEFLRLLAPGGLLLFQIPSRPRDTEATWIERTAHSFYYRFLWDILHPNTPHMNMFAIPKSEVIRLIGRHGGMLVDAVPDPSAEPQWEGFRYLVKRAEPDPEIVPAVPDHKAMTEAD